MPGSPAAATDLAAGDEVLAVDGELVHSVAELKRAIAARAVGQKLRLRVLGRFGSPRELSLAPAYRPSELALARQRLLGKRAPSFSLARLGAPADAPHETLASYRGKTMLLDFWATWCGPCLRSMPELAALHRKWAARGLEVIGIAAEEAGLLKATAARVGIQHPILVDAQELAFRTYGVTALPTMVLVDRTGVVRAVEVGAGTDAIEQHLAELLGRPE